MAFPLIADWTQKVQTVPPQPTPASQVEVFVANGQLVCNILKSDSKWIKPSASYMLPGQIKHLLFFDNACFRVLLQACGADAQIFYYQRSVYSWALQFLVFALLSLCWAFFTSQKGFKIVCFLASWLFFLLLFFISSASCLVFFFFLVFVFLLAALIILLQWNMNKVRKQDTKIAFVNYYNWVKFTSLLFFFFFFFSFECLLSFSVKKNRILTLLL